MGRILSPEKSVPTSKQCALDVYDLVFAKFDIPYLESGRFWWRSDQRGKSKNRPKIKFWQGFQNFVPIQKSTSFGQRIRCIIVPKITIFQLLYVSQCFKTWYHGYELLFIWRSDRRNLTLELIEVSFNLKIEITID